VLQLRHATGTARSGQEAFSTTVFRNHDTRVIFVRGDVDLASCEQLRSTIVGELAPQASIRVDLSRVTFMDSTAIAVLLMAKMVANRQGGSFAIRNPSAAASRVLLTTGLDRLIADT